MKFNFEQAKIGESFAENSKTKLEPYREKLIRIVEGGDYFDSESSINLPSDERTRAEIKEFAREKGEELSLVIVVGIGGSSLGAKAVYEALRTKTRQGPKMIFIETVDARALTEIENIFQNLEDPAQVLICVISKSGRTLETAANAEIIYGSFASRFPEKAKEQTVVISDKGSELYFLAQNEGFAFFEIPEKVGGRFSVFSAVGLLPLALAGIDIDEFSYGASKMRDEIIFTKENPAIISATALAHHYEQGRDIHDTFIFDPSLTSLGNWYRQLLGESIGKSKTENGQIHVGITPTISIGSTDLHSVGQLYFGGPQDVRFTTFLRRESFSPDPTIPSVRIFSRAIPELENKSSEEILSALSRGAKDAYIEAELPFIDVSLTEISEFELGEFLQWKMLEIMFLAQLLGVNAFDQPAVEAYKKATRRILSE